MKRLDRLPQPIKYFAYILISSSFFGVWLLYDLSRQDGFDLHFSIFVAVSMLVHISVGFAVLSLKKWGLVVFKCYLYVLFLAIPVGTYISYKTLNYIESNNLSDYYV